MPTQASGINSLSDYIATVVKRSNENKVAIKTIGASLDTIIAGDKNIVTTLTTSQTVFTNDQELVTKKFVEDSHTPVTNVVKTDDATEQTMIGNLRISSTSGDFVTSSASLNAINTSLNAQRVAIGEDAGVTSQSVYTVAIGNNAGANSQGAQCVAVGNQAGNVTQGVGSIALGSQAGFYSLGASAIAIGYGAGFGGLAENAISIGINANSGASGLNSIALGPYIKVHGVNGIGIGAVDNQNERTTAINSSGSTLVTSTDDALYIKPVRAATTGNILTYNTDGEVTSSSTSLTSIETKLNLISVSGNDIGDSTTAMDNINTNAITLANSYQPTSPGGIKGDIFAVSDGSLVYRYNNILYPVAGPKMQGYFDMTQDVTYYMDSFICLRWDVTNDQPSFSCTTPWVHFSMSYTIANIAPRLFAGFFNPPSTIDSYYFNGTATGEPALVNTGTQSHYNFYMMVNGTPRKTYKILIYSTSGNNAAFKVEVI